MRHLINLLQNGLFVNDKKLYDIFSLLSDYNNANLSVNDMKFLTNTLSGNISLYKLFTHIRNIDTAPVSMTVEIDNLIKQTLGEYNLHELKIKITSMKMKTLDQLTKFILSIPINEFTVNMSAAPVNDDIPNAYEQKLSLLLSTTSELFNRSATTLDCSKEIDMKSIDIYRGPPLYFDQLTKLLSSLLAIPVTRIWQTKHTNAGYACQMIIVNILMTIMKQLPSENHLPYILASIQRLNGISSVSELKEYVNNTINAVKYVAVDSNEINSINNNSKYQQPLQHLQVIASIVDTFDESDASSVKKIDDLVLAKLRDEFVQLNGQLEADGKILEVRSPVNNYTNNNSTCYSLNRITLKLIFTSYRKFRNGVKLAEFQNIACPLHYKQCITIFPFYAGQNISIQQSNCNGDPCTRNDEMLSLIPNSIYNPVDISATVIKKLQLLISYIQFDGNYRQFETIVRLIPFDIDDISSILTIVYAMENIVYVTVAAAVYAFHLSTTNVFQVFNMYHLVCLLGPDAYGMQLHQKLNLPPINVNYDITQLHLLPINILFSSHLDLYSVSFKELESILNGVIEKNNGHDRYCRNIIMSRNISEYTIWLYLLFMHSQTGNFNYADYTEREYYLYKMLQGIVENPYELYYINLKLQSSYGEMQQTKQKNDTILYNNKSGAYGNNNNNEEMAVSSESSEAENINECTLDMQAFDQMKQFNYEIEQHDVAAIYGKLIAAGFDIKNDIGVMFQYALQSDDGHEFIEFIKEYLSKKANVLDYCS